MKDKFTLIDTREILMSVKISKSIQEKFLSLKRKSQSPNLFGYSKPVKHSKTSAEIVQPSALIKLPGAQPTIRGELPKPLYLWKMKENEFPSFEESGVDIKTYLEQKDVYARRRVLDMKEFCQGSIIRVTWYDVNSKSGTNTFTGVVMHKSHWDNRMGAAVVLRNVIDRELFEVTIPIYSGNILKFEILRHTYMTQEQLKLLRELPIEYSQINEKIKTEKYSEQPREREVPVHKVFEIHSYLRNKLKAIKVPITTKQRNRDLNSNNLSRLVPDKLLWPIYRPLTREEQLEGREYLKTKDAKKFKKSKKKF